MPSTDHPLLWPLKSQHGSLGEQLTARIRTAIGAGRLKPGDKLPSTRRLAQELEIARGTATGAIEQLVAEGLLKARPGAGTYVSRDAVAACVERDQISEPDWLGGCSVPAPDIDGVCDADIDFRPCRPSVSDFPVAAWRRCVSLSSSMPLSPDYDDPMGAASLREALADYLRRVRGMSVAVDEIMITNGAVHAMHLVSSVYLQPGDQVAFEDPGYPLARQTFALSGARLVFVQVDDEGLRVSRLRRRKVAPKFVYVTPSHQFPVGSRLSLRRRNELLTWAEANDAMVIEDDYDGEFRYDVSPLPPLAAMAPNRVIYCGTFSKSMFPGLRVGYAVAPRKVLRQLARYRAISEYTAAQIHQNALAQFIVDGHFERHVHRMRRVYSAKRQHVTETIGARRPRWSVSGIESGLSVLMHLCNEVTANTLSDQARRQGILLMPVDRYAVTKAARRNAIVLGYAEPTLAKIVKGLETVLATH